MVLKNTLKGLMAVLVCFCIAPTAHAQLVSPTTVTATAPLGTSGGSSGLGNLYDGSFVAASFQRFTGAGSITYDFGSTQTISRMVIVGQVQANLTQDGSNNITQGGLETSIDGVNWTPVSTFSNPNKGEGTVFSYGFTPVQMRYARINLTSPNVTTEGLTEISFYNSGGPNLSLVEYRATNRKDLGFIPYNVVDHDPATIGMWLGSAGGFTLRLDDPAYANGWDSLTLAGRGYLTAGAANPGILTIKAGNDPGDLAQIYQQANAEATSNWEYVLNFSETYHYDYLEVSWTGNGYPVQNNVQISGVTVHAVPEPASVVLLLISGAGLVGARWLRRSNH